jgi:hypothetical protein
MVTPASSTTSPSPPPGPSAFLLARPPSIGYNLATTSTTVSPSIDDVSDHPGERKQAVDRFLARAELANVSVPLSVVVPAILSPSRVICIYFPHITCDFIHSPECRSVERGHVAPRRVPGSARSASIGGRPGFPPRLGNPSLSSLFFVFIV